MPLHWCDNPSSHAPTLASQKSQNKKQKIPSKKQRVASNEPFSLCHAEGKSLYQQQRYTQKKSEDCAWTPVVDEELLKFLKSVEHKAGWIPYQNGHAQVSYRAEALRTPDPYYTSKQYFFRTSTVKRKGVWWLLEMNADTRKEKNLISLEEAETRVSIFLPAERTYLASAPQLTPEVVEELLEHFMDPVHGSNSKGRKTIGMCCLHVGDLFVTGTPEFLEKFKRTWRCEWFDVHWSTCEMATWWEDKEEITHSCWTITVCKWTYWDCHTEGTKGWWEVWQGHAYCISFITWKHKLVAMKEHSFKHAISSLVVLLQQQVPQ